MNSLNVAYKDLQAEVGFFLGYGRGPDLGEEEWDDRQKASIKRCVQGGLRNFYFCGYDWSFLKPVSTFALSASSSTVALPDDFGGIEGRITVTTSGSSGFAPIPVVGDVRQRFAEWPDATGFPECAAIEPLKGSTTGQRHNLRVYPTSDQAYTLTLRYYLNPDYLSGLHPYAYGGTEHAETLLESCLAVAEKILDDKAAIHAMEFQQRLSVSQDIDRRKKPQVMGYNGDRSDGRPYRRRSIDGVTTTFGGVAYE